MSTFGISDKEASFVASGAHNVAQFMPGMMGGTAVELAADMLDSEVLRKGLVQMHLRPIFERMVKQGVLVEDEATGKFRDVKLGDLARKSQDGTLVITDKAVELLDDPEHATLLPPVLWDEWMRAQDVTSKGTIFTAQTGVQVAAGGVASMLVPGGGWLLNGGVSLGAGLGAGKLMDPIISELMGGEEKLTVSMVLPEIHQVGALQQTANKDPKAPVHIDTGLLGAYLIAAHPEQLGDMNDTTLLTMVKDHADARKQGSNEFTQLDMYLQNHQENFAPLLPEGLDYSKYPTTNPLEILAMHVHEQRDLEDILFDPHVFEQKIAQQNHGKDQHQQATPAIDPRIQQATPAIDPRIQQAGRTLRQNMQHMDAGDHTPQPPSLPGLPPHGRSGRSGNGDPSLN